jgi:hypothetical protein
MIMQQSVSVYAKLAGFVLLCTLSPRKATCQQGNFPS